MNLGSDGLGFGVCLGYNVRSIVISSVNSVDFIVNVGTHLKSENCQKLATKVSTFKSWL